MKITCIQNNRLLGVPCIQTANWICVPKQQSRDMQATATLLPRLPCYIVATRRPWRYACRLLYYCAQNSTRIMSCPRVPFHRMPRCNSTFLSVCGLSVMAFFTSCSPLSLPTKVRTLPTERTSDRQTRGLVQQTPGFSLIVALSWQRPLPPFLPTSLPTIPPFPPLHTLTRLHSTQF